MPIEDTSLGRPLELGVIGEYRVDGGLWVSIHGPVVDLPDGGHAVQVRLYGWCRYEAALRGSGGIVDVAAVPLYYKEPRGVPVPSWAHGHTIKCDMTIDAVTFIEPEFLSTRPQVRDN